jgi:hypothetical protein
MPPAIPTRVQRALDLAAELQFELSCSRELEAGRRGSKGADAPFKIRRLSSGTTPESACSPRTGMPSSRWGPLRSWSSAITEVQISPRAVLPKGNAVLLIVRTGP